MRTEIDELLTKLKEIKYRMKELQQYAQEHNRKYNKCIICGKNYKLPNYVYKMREYICFTCEVKIKFLAPREQKILEMRLGGKDELTHTLEEVARHFGVTRERIRQIEAKSFQRVKHLNN